MSRLPRAPHTIAGIPLTKKTVKDLGLAAIDIATGRHVPLQMAEQRMSICESCDHFNGVRCTLCGCFMRKKVSLPSAKCPAHKW